MTLGDRAGDLDDEGAARAAAASNWSSTCSTSLKIKDQPTREVTTHRETGESLYTMTVMVMEDGRAEVLKITVPESGLAAELKPGVMVRPVELFAAPWARIFNGQLSDGAPYRAARLTKCGKLVKVIDPEIGGDSVGASMATKKTQSNPVPQTQQFVAVRKGAAVALYWDRHNDAPAIRTLAKHQSDAAKMATKLCSIGGC